MSEQDPRPDDTSDDTDEVEPSGLVDSDDTTQADAGMVGGAGAAPNQATVKPYATEQGDAEDDEAGGGG